MYDYDELIAEVDFVYKYCYNGENNIEKFIEWLYKRQSDKTTSANKYKTGDNL